MSTCTSFPNEFNYIQSGTLAAFRIGKYWYKGTAISKQMYLGYETWTLYDANNVIFMMAEGQADEVLWLNTGPFASEMQKQYMRNKYPDVAKMWEAEK